MEQIKEHHDVVDHRRRREASDIVDDAFGNIGCRRMMFETKPDGSYADGEKPWTRYGREIAGTEFVAKVFYFSDPVQILFLGNNPGLRDFGDGVEREFQKRGLGVDIRYGS